MPDQSSAATEHAILSEITQPLSDLHEDPLAMVDADFPHAMRGYDRDAVDHYVRQTRQLVAELQATRSPEAAVRRALERVGEQISGILQRAHETAEQITAQSRSEAEDRLEVARAEAAQITQAAEQRVRELDADTDRIWLERQRIVADAEDLAGQLTALAKVAAERFPADDEVAAVRELTSASEHGLGAGEPVAAGEESPTRPFDVTADHSAGDHSAGDHAAGDHAAGEPRFSVAQRGPSAAAGEPPVAEPEPPVADDGSAAGQASNEDAPAGEQPDPWADAAAERPDPWADAAAEQPDPWAADAPLAEQPDPWADGASAAGAEDESPAGDAAQAIGEHTFDQAETEPPIAEPENREQPQPTVAFDVMADGDEPSGSGETAGQSGPGETAGQSGPGGTGPGETVGPSGPSEPDGPPRRPPFPGAPPASAIPPASQAAHRRFWPSR